MLSFKVPKLLIKEILGCFVTLLQDSFAFCKSFLLLLNKKWLFAGFLTHFLKQAQSGISFVYPLIPSPSQLQIIPALAAPINSSPSMYWHSLHILRLVDCEYLGHHSEAAWLQWQHQGHSSHQLLKHIRGGWLGLWFICQHIQYLDVR